VGGCQGSMGCRSPRAKGWMSCSKERRASCRYAAQYPVARRRWGGLLESSRQSNRVLVLFGRVHSGSVWHMRRWEGRTPRPTRNQRFGGVVWCRGLRLREADSGVEALWPRYRNLVVLRKKNNPAGKRLL